MKMPVQIFRKSAFTMVELLMAVALIAILATMAITQYQDFSSESRDAQIRESLGVLRNSIARHYSQMRIRCGVTNSAWPAAADLAANDITNNAACTTVQVSSAADRVFVNNGIPAQAWGGTPSSNALVQCTGANGCVQANTYACDNNAYVTTDSGWCYNVNTGEIWANSNNNTNEYSF